MSASDLVIVGAGCAGLSLAVHLVEQGIRDRKILLIEPRRSYENDRTWSFWRTDRHPFESCVSRQWLRWRVRADERTVTRGSSKFPYQTMRADAFYEHALERLRSAPNVEVRLGTRVLAVRDTGDRVEVDTDRGAIRASLVFDSRPRHDAPRRRTGLLQHFLGREVVMPEPVFDPSVAMLMDFSRVADGIHFVYLLPTSGRRALVESTWISSTPVSSDTYRREIARYLQGRYGSEPTSVEREERGVLPMRVSAGVRQATRRVIPIGTRGGAIRPSSGYGFLAIQRFSAEMARRLSRSDLPAPPRMYGARSRVLDGIFLTHLGRVPERAPEMFVDLFERVPARSLIRFLSDRGNLLDDLRVIASMPKREFGVAALASLRPAWSNA